MKPSRSNSTFVTPRRLFLLALLLILAGCTQRPTLPTTAPALKPSPTPGPVNMQVTRAPDPQLTARAYLDAWKAEDYKTMYSLLTEVSQGAMSEDEFVKHYQGVAVEAALGGIDYEVQRQYIADPEQAQVNYHVVLHSRIVGDVQGDTTMNLSQEQGQWRVQWNDTLILPELAGGNYLGMELNIPSRANIYDLNGHALVARADATSIGVYPDNIIPDQLDTVLNWVSRLTGLRVDTVQGRLDNVLPGGGWYVPFGVVPASLVENNFNTLSGISGLEMHSYKARYYVDGGVAPHVVGYVGAIQPDQVDEYKRMGYRQDERVGQAGLEKWGEQYLAGKRGGKLYVFDSQGRYVTELGESPTAPSQAIFTTLDKDFQEGVQGAINGFKGAVVVLELNTGRVLAMASAPSYDPNAFEMENYNSSSTLAEIFNDSSLPLYNRATQGQYPLGSVFKIVTMAAALESGRFTPDSTYQCGYEFTELGQPYSYDWTWEHFQQDGRTQPSGLLTLQGGLIRSCNPWFWHIGVDLYNAGLTKAVSDMARGFGLGQKTGIQGVEELPGDVPDPQSVNDAKNLAIGQGDFTTTPLQVADFVAAVGNGGTLYKPQIIERIAPPDGDPTFQFKPEVRGKLPVSPENLLAIQQAMQGVINSQKPRGTAYHIFTGMNVPLAGKTGTAESGSGLPHAWFAGYTSAGRTDKPDIAIAVLVENIGEGSDYAAPIFRRVVELYFNGRPGRLYSWESAYGVTATPTLDVTETPTPEPGSEETPSP